MVVDKNPEKSSSNNPYNGKPSKYPVQKGVPNFNAQPFQECQCRLPNLYPRHLPILLACPRK